MRAKKFRWYVAPGFSVIHTMRAVVGTGIVQTLHRYRDHVSVAPKDKWRRVEINITVERIRKAA